MSEYQYYEWQTVDRVLTAAEQAAVNQLSSHIEVSPGKAVVTYNWSDFRHDPKQVLLSYFDAFFYQANWGSFRLMFRFPKGLLDEKELEPYLVGENVSFETHGKYQVLDIDYNPEDGGDMEWVDSSLSDFIGLRADLLRGDYRLLYLIWLHENAYYGEPEEDQDEDEDEVDGEDQEEDEDSQMVDLEPPIPSGLKRLTPALQNIEDVLGIDPFLVQAAAEDSLDLRNPPNVDYRELIGHMSRAECDDFLARLAADDAGVGMALRKRLSELLPHGELSKTAGKRTLRELLQRASQLEELESKQQTEKAREQRAQAMEALAKREAQVWQEVERLLENGPKIASVYNEATALLDQLWDLSEYQNTHANFQSRLRKLAEKYASRPSLMTRWKQKGWM